MVLDEVERNFIRQEMVETLEKVDYESIYSSSREQRAYARRKILEYRSNPEYKEKEKEQGRLHKRVVTNSKIDPNDSSSTRDSPKYSSFEIENRAIIRKVFPFNELRFNSRPLFLYNPLTKGRMEGDCIDFTTKVIFESNEKKSHSGRVKQIRDLHKEEIAKFHKWDLIVIKEDVEDVESHIRQEWQKILEKRMKE